MDDDFARGGGETISLGSADVSAVKRVERGGGNSGERRAKETKVKDKLGAPKATVPM
jgi:hypothetical protein